MIKLPFQITFDLDFSEKLPNKILLDRLENMFLNINPSPMININFKEINRYLHKFITDIMGNFSVDIIAVNPVLNDKIYNLLEKQIINIKITDNKYNLSELSNYTYNLILPFRDNLYEYIQKFNCDNIKKIIIMHNKDRNSYSNLKVYKKCYLIPYLEEYEQEKFYSDGAIRPFLTCAAPWINPIIDSNGKIHFPCYCSLGSIAESDFFELWNSNGLNCLRNKLITFKQFNKCKYCEKFYKENFLIVEDGILEYKNKKFIFDNILNPVKSAPAIGIVSDGKICMPVPLYSDIEIQKLFTEDNLKLIIK